MQTWMTQREQHRTDYDPVFLENAVGQVKHGRDPKNYIGLDCGVSWGRVFEIYFRRIFEGEA